MFAHITSIPLDLGHMRMEYMTINLIGKRNSNREDIYQAILTIFIITMKILSNSKMKWNRKKD